MGPFRRRNHKTLCIICIHDEEGKLEKLYGKISRTVTKCGALTAFSFCQRFIEFKSRSNMSILDNDSEVENDQVVMPPAWAVPTFLKNFEATRFQQGMK